MRTGFLDRSSTGFGYRIRLAAALVPIAAAAALALGAGSAAADPALDAGDGPSATEATPSADPVYDGFSTHCSGADGYFYCPQYDKRGRQICTITELPLGGGSAAAYNWLPNTICDIQVTIANALP
ncbi:hypothetical protein [Nocardia sp. BMG51109]|uniref:hypothetical protein n=1 Tax=Nocardia sp. BMG51109 TaxID=1056816 RepID=UPI0004661E3D|nr:hypothetical protein [Nocardia sp. BMG51109]